MGKEDKKLKVKLCGDHPTLLAFTAMDSCGHCKKMAPCLEQLRRDDVYLDGTRGTHGLGFHLRQYDIGDKGSSRIMESFKIQAYPTLLVYIPSKMAKGSSSSTGDYRLYHYNQGDRSYDGLKKVVFDLEADKHKPPCPFWLHVPTV